MKKLLILLLIPLTVSCVTQKRCLQRFPPVTDTVRIVKDSIRVITRDTTIFIHLPGEVKIDSVIIPCPPPKADFIPDTAYAYTTLAFAKAWWKYPSIKLKLVQKDSTINAELKNALTEKFYWHSEYDRVTKVYKEKYVPGFWKFCSFAFIGICVALIGFVVWKLK